MRALDDKLKINRHLGELPKDPTKKLLEIIDFGARKEERASQMPR